MGRHGRQQLLSRSRDARKQGQAIIELLPSVIIFFTVIVAGLNYFRVMRAAVIRQEVVRNSVFALINNSGTLTTPPNLLSDVGSTSTRPAGVESGVPVIAAHTFVGGTSNCFSVSPPELEAAVGTPLMPMFASGGTPVVKFLTYAVINRQPGGNCAR